MKRPREESAVTKKIKKNTVMARVIPRLSFFSYKNVDGLYLTQFGRKMSYNDLHNLKYVNYKQL